MVVEKCGQFSFLRTDERASLPFIRPIDIFSGISRSLEASLLHASKLSSFVDPNYTFCAKRTKRWKTDFYTVSCYLIFFLTTKQSRFSFKPVWYVTVKH